MGPNQSVLESDDRIVCEDASHRALQGVSGVVVALIAFGLPVLFSWILIQSARDYERTSKGPNAKMAKQLAQEMHTELTVAEYVIRDVQIGEDYSFLMDAYVPKYLYELHSTGPQVCILCSIMLNLFTYVVILASLLRN